MHTARALKVLASLRGQNEGVADAGAVVAGDLL